MTHRSDCSTGSLEGYIHSDIDRTIKGRAVLTATRLVNGKRQILPLQSRHPLTEYQKIVTDDYFRDSNTCASQLWCQSVMENSVEIGETQRKLLLLIYTPCLEKVPLCFASKNSNFVICRPIFKILSLTDLSVNLSQSNNKTSHHTSNALRTINARKTETAWNDRSQRSVAMRFRRGRIFDNYFIANLLLSLLWKNFWNSSTFCKVTGKS